MSQARSSATPLFRSSLRDWQAAYKARQAESAPSLDQPEQTQDNDNQETPKRVKKLLPRRKKAKRAAAAR